MSGSVTQEGEILEVYSSRIKGMVNTYKEIKNVKIVSPIEGRHELFEIVFCNPSFSISVNRGYFGPVYFNPPFVRWIKRLFGFNCIVDDLSKFIDNRNNSISFLLGLPSTGFSFVEEHMLHHTSTTSEKRDIVSSLSNTNTHNKYYFLKFVLFRTLSFPFSFFIRKVKTPVVSQAWSCFKKKHAPKAASSALVNRISGRGANKGIKRLILRDKNILALSQANQFSLAFSQEAIY
jgi:hypothetical protein